MKSQEGLGGTSELHGEVVGSLPQELVPVLPLGTHGNGQVLPGIRLGTVGRCIDCWQESFPLGCCFASNDPGFQDEFRWNGLVLDRLNLLRSQSELTRKQHGHHKKELGPRHMSPA